MTVVIDEHSGFCFGVINAIHTAEEYLVTHDYLYCLGDIVHNNEEVKRLTSIGLRVISAKEFSNLQNENVLIRAHGEPPETYAIAQQNHIHLIDATCPVVLRLQKRILDFHLKPANANRQILIFGKQGHAEVIGLMGQTDRSGIVLSSIDEIDKIDYQRPAILYSQTTQGVEQYFELIEAIQKRYKAAGHDHYLQYADTICRKVANRAIQIADFAKQHDALLFVSGEKSSNGLYLFDICKAHNPNSYLISQPNQLQQIDFNNIKSIGICGATSTPMWLMEKIAAEVRRKFENLIHYITPFRAKPKIEKKESLNKEGDDRIIQHSQ